MGSGFAGEFYCRCYSCLFGKFVVQMCSAWISDQDWLIRFPSGSLLLYLGGETLAGRTDWEQAAEKRDVGDVERSVAMPGYLAWSKERASSAKKAVVSHNAARKYLR